MMESHSNAVLYLQTHGKHMAIAYHPLYSTRNTILDKKYFSSRSYHHQGADACHPYNRHIYYTTPTVIPTGITISATIIHLCMIASMYATFAASHTSISFNMYPLSVQPFLTTSAAIYMFAISRYIDCNLPPICIKHVICNLCHLCSIMMPQQTAAHSLIAIFSCDMCAPFMLGEAALELSFCCPFTTHARQAMSVLCLLPDSGSVLGVLVHALAGPRQLKIAHESVFGHRT